MNKAFDCLSSFYEAAQTFGQRNVKIVRQSLKLACALVLVVIAVSEGKADTPALNNPIVHTNPIQPGQSYVDVHSNTPEFFDVGGYCKVVQVGDLSGMNPPADSIPVFVPGSAEQWENFRTLAPDNYGGRLTSTTCCRPNPNIATLCAGGTDPQPASRDYGVLGESEPVSRICKDIRGQTYTDTIIASCQGYTDPSHPAAPAGPDGQASWVTASEICTDTPWTSACNAVCSGGTTATGTTTSYNSCGVPVSTSSCSINCCTPSYSYACNGASYIRTDNTCGGGSVVVGTCRYVTSHATVACSAPNSPDVVPNSCGGNTTYHDCMNSWPDTSMYDTCTPNACVPEQAPTVCCNPGGCHTDASPCGVRSVSCIYSRWVYP